MDQEQPQQNHKEEEHNHAHGKIPLINCFMEGDLHPQQSRTDEFVMSCLGLVLDAWEMKEIRFMVEIYDNMVVFQDLYLEALSKIIIKNKPVVKI